MAQTALAKTPNVQLIKVEANATGQATRINENTNALDVLIPKIRALDKDLNTPPGSPTEGDVYIISTSPTGAWSGKAKYITGYYNSAWVFWQPRSGWDAWVHDEAKDYRYDGTNWVEITTAPTTAPTWTVVSKTASFTASLSEAAIYLISAGAANITVTLPAASGAGSRAFTFKRTDANLVYLVTIDGNASETIDGELTIQLATQYESVTLACDGSNWLIV
jgi:hypothetical protein